MEKERTNKEIMKFKGIYLHDIGFKAKNNLNYNIYTKHIQNNFKYEIRLERRAED